MKKEIKHNDEPSFLLALEMLKNLLFACCLAVSSLIFAQPRKYTTANAHSHNDYEKPNPFTEAYKHQFGSIEADIFLIPGSEDLFVAHAWRDLNNVRRTLDSLYLVPLANAIHNNNGNVYADGSRRLQLLVDIKTDAVPTLDRLIQALKKYPALTNSRTLQIVISGNRPSADSFHLYPSFIYFDGVIGNAYSPQALSRIPLFSASFGQFSSWKGHDRLPAKDSVGLSAAITLVHKLGKPVRLWAAPDNAEAWKSLMHLGVDYINTDRIAELSEFLKTQK